MRKSLLVGSVLLSAALTATGCVDNNTGDVGQKNIRPHYANDYEKNGLSMNGTYSYGSPTYRTRFANDQANEQNRRITGGNRIGNGITTRNQAQNGALNGAQNGMRNGAGNGGQNAAQGRFEINERIAGQIAALPEVGDAYVATMGRNAYVALLDQRHVISPYGANVNNELRNKITKKVKSMAPNIQNVYVSVHPEAIERLQWYSLAAKAGQPVQDFLPEFNSFSAKRFSSAKIIR